MAGPLLGVNMAKTKPQPSPDFDIRSAVAAAIQDATAALDKSTATVSSAALARTLVPVHPSEATQTAIRRIVHTALATAEASLGSVPRGSRQAMSLELHFLRGLPGLLERPGPVDGRIIHNLLTHLVRLTKAVNEPWGRQVSLAPQRETINRAILGGWVAAAPLIYGAFAAAQRPTSLSAPPEKRGLPFLILSHLCKQPGGRVASVAELARAIKIDRKWVGVEVEKLCSQGLIEPQLKKQARNREVRISSAGRVHHERECKEFAAKHLP